MTPGQLATLRSMQRRARRAVQHAIDDGRLVRPDACFFCHRSGPTHAHHQRGYSREFRLDVIWLCPACHHQQHPTRRPTKPVPPKPIRFRSVAGDRREYHKLYVREWRQKKRESVLTGEQCQ